MRTVNEMTKRINEMLSAKIDSEYYAFLDELEKKEPKEIIAASYQIQQMERKNHMFMAKLQKLLLLSNLLMAKRKRK